MARRKKHADGHVNHERWLVSYADFITLLFAFFVVMYSLSSLNEGKYRVMSNSVGMAFGKFNAFSSSPMQNAPKLNPNPDSGKAGGVESGPNAGIGTGFSIVKKKGAADEPLKKEREKMGALANSIFKALAPLIREGKVRMTQTSRGILIDINASVLFASGEAKLTTGSIQVLEAVASVLVEDNHAIQVEGFTDNVPIKNEQFPSNWELSAVRAGRVARLFVDSGVAEDRLTAIGQGPKNPVASNETADGRSKNRRVNITIMAILPEKRTELPVSTN